MPKKPIVESVPAAGYPGISGVKPSPATQQTILSNVNAIVQSAIRIALLASTDKCKCPVCNAARRMAPHVNKILELGEGVTQVKTV